VVLSQTIMTCLIVHSLCSGKCPPIDHLSKRDTVVLRVETDTCSARSGPVLANAAITLWQCADCARSRAEPDARISVSVPPPASPRDMAVTVSATVKACIRPHMVAMVSSTSRTCRHRRSCAATRMRAARTGPISVSANNNL
jgi:hypothetical protein